jgi:hypothetical protein
LWRRPQCFTAVILQTVTLSSHKVRGAHGIVETGAIRATAGQKALEHIEIEP